METTNKNIAVLRMNTRDGGFETEVIDREKKENRFKQRADTRKDEWDHFIGMMSPLNIDLANVAKPIYRFKFKLDGRQFKFAIYTDPRIVNFASRKDQLNTSVYQIFYGNKSLIIRINFHPMCNRKWDDTKIMTSPLNSGQF